MMNAMPAEKQAEFRAVFGNAAPHEDFQKAGMWITENEEEDDVLQETVDKIKAIMASCPEF